MQPPSDAGAIADGGRPDPAEEHVILVNDRDEAIGTAEKLAAHQGEGQLHRAFSIYLFGADGRMLLQRRACGKYHFPSLWTNACCSHPRPGESLSDAARRRLFEELGLEAELEPLFAFLYAARDDESGLVEREVDHVFAGRVEDEPRPNAEEVGAIDWRDPEKLLRDCVERPERFTPWFRLGLEELRARGHLAVWSAPLRP